VKGFHVGGAPYLFLLKSDTGEAQVRKINADGTVGPSIATYHWTPDWTVSEFYEVGGVTFLLLIKGQDLNKLQYTPSAMVPAGSGKARIYRINSDGTVGPLVKEFDWSSGWSIARTYSVGQQTYLFLLKSSTGAVRIRGVQADGTPDEAQPAISYDWSSGWTTAEFEQNNGASFLYLGKSHDGTMKVYKMRPDGRVGSLIREYKSGFGWSSLTFYHVGGDLFGLRVRAIGDS
jgi:hypothetical protein